MNSVSSTPAIQEAVRSGDEEYVHANGALKNFGRISLSELFGERIIYRNLEPMDRSLRGLSRAYHEMGLSDNRIPRKQESGYAKAALWLVEETQARRHQPPIRELLFIGDSKYTDAQSFLNLRKRSGWRGACFIGVEDVTAEPALTADSETHVYTSNRWALLAKWVEALLDAGMLLNERTAVIVDIDKTAIGARGRNDAVIDEARLEGIYRALNAVLGEHFDRVAFERHYTELNQSTYHGLTSDNQDYLGYICLVINAGLISFDEVVDRVQNGSLNEFAQFVRWVDSRVKSGSAGERVRQAHEAVSTSVRMGDPTPFKRFRRQELVTTLEHMGNLPDSSDVYDLLEREITITSEVADLARWLQARDCLLICLSDKPDESAVPSARTPSDLLPLHQTKTHCVGTSISEALENLS